MGKQLFGTDGIRGTTNIYPMTAEMMLKVGIAIGIFLNGAKRVVIGKDTRLSGYMFESALTAGLTSAGINVILIGPIPTPGIAMLTKSLRADLGIMISASHNPYHDNGIKLFDANGFKLSDIKENEIVQILNSKMPVSHFSNIGKASRLDDARGRYIEFAKNTIPRYTNLNDLKVVIDCANGAAYNIGKQILWELGMDVIAINDQPDGYNINYNCGSSYPEGMHRQVLRHNADIGIALDGDCDRVVICDEKGKVITGDQVIAAIAKDKMKNKALSSDLVVTTIMSCAGLEYYLQNLGVRLIRTQVGDRYVAEKMREVNCNVGGEHSGHIILGDYTTTGDGIITALALLSLLVRENKPVSELFHDFKPLPRITHNIRYTDEVQLENSNIKKIIKCLENDLEDTERLIVRRSGTEPILRIVAEGSDVNRLERMVSYIRNSFEMC